MARELVLLSDIPLTPQILADVGNAVLPDGTGISYRNGEITQFIDAENRPVATVFDSVPVHVATEAEAVLKDAPPAFALWTEITVPFAPSPASTALPTALAEAVGGTIREKK